MKTINNCRVCREKKLDFALKIEGVSFVFCKNCTALQRGENIPYEIDFNFSGGVLELDYFPIDLSCIKKESVILWNLKSFSHLLKMAGYRVTQASVVEKKLVVTFDKLSPLERIEFFEEIKRFDNKFTYFLIAIRLKKE